MQLVESAFNYELHGARGFEVIARIIESCACYEFTYSNLEEAAELFGALAAAQ
jgi:hypothetical protein